MPFVFKLLTGTLVVFNIGFLMPCVQEVPPTMEQAIRKGVTIKVAPAPDDFGDLSESDVVRIREWLDSLPKEYFADSLPEEDLIDLTESVGG